MTWGRKFVNPFCWTNCVSLRNQEPHWQTQLRGNCISPVYARWYLNHIWVVLFFPSRYLPTYWVSKEIHLHLTTWMPSVDSGNWSSRCNWSYLLISQFRDISMSVFMLYCPWGLKYMLQMVNFQVFGRFPFPEDKYQHGAVQNIMDHSKSSYIPMRNYM